MATGLVIHISSGKDKHTQVLTDESVRIGNCEDCAVRLRSSSLPKSTRNDGLVLELARRNGSYLITGFDESLNLKLNGKPLEFDAEIADARKRRSDSLRLDKDGKPKVRQPTKLMWRLS